MRPELMEWESSLLLIIDIQQRLMPAIDQGSDVILNAGRLIEAARMLEVPAVVTEQNPDGLGPTVDDLSVDVFPLIKKMTFDSCPAAGFWEAVGSERSLIVVGCEAHVCVAQTVLGLLSNDRRVFVVSDAVGSRTQANKDAALKRLERAGAEIVTTEMVVFEWLKTADHPAFRSLAKLIK